MLEAGRIYFLFFLFCFVFFGLVCFSLTSIVSSHFFCQDVGNQNAVKTELTRDAQGLLGERTLPLLNVPPTLELR